MRLAPPLFAIALVACGEGGTPTGKASTPDADTPQDAVGTVGTADTQPVLPSGGVVLSLRFEPADLSTNVGAATPRVTVPTSPSSAGVLDDATLVTWPELAEVPYSKTTTENAVDLLPTSPLGDRWYAIRLSKGVPPPYERPWWLKRLPDGSVVARFRTGSQPMVQDVQLGKKGVSVYSISITMSEAVSAPTGIEAATMVDASTGATFGCAQVDAVGFPVKSLWLRCSTLAAEVKLTMSSNLKTPAGIAATAEHRFRPTELPNACGVDCVVFRP